MSYFIENEQTTTNNIAGIKIIASIISKTNLVFSNLFGRSQLNKIATTYNNPISIFVLKSSLLTITSKTMPPAHIKRSNAFSKLNIIFNIFKEYLTNIVTTSYKREV